MDISKNNLESGGVFRNNFNQMSLRSRYIEKKQSNDAIRINNQYTKRKGRTKGEIGQSLLRNKRHAEISHEIYTNHETTDEFLKKLFQQFGNADGTSMNVIGFERMLRQLGLYNLIEDKIPKEDQLLKLSKTNETCISSIDLISRLSSGSHQALDNIYHHDEEKSIHNEEFKPIAESARSSINSTGENHSHEHKEIKNGVMLNTGDLYSICPILLYQLAAPTSLERSGCIDSSLIPHKVFLPPSEREDRLLVWVYASASVLGVSLVGLLGVLVIPCMDKHFYQHVIQFLVALAVGTLAGDALLHLLPHSMMTFVSEADGHASMTWKGLIAVLGIIFFFATERGLTMMAEWRKKIEKKEKPSSRVRVMRDPDSMSVNNSTAGDKLCKHKYSSYPYCYDEIAMDTKDDHHHHHQDPKIMEIVPTPIACNKNSIHNYRNKHDHGDTHETAQSLLPHNYTTISDSYSVINKDESTNPDNNTISTNLDDASIEGIKDKDLVREETFTIILREHESSHHGHSHKHGHVHSPPRSLSAVAWMVIMGDGLHNFTDGMAIGAAFSNNIAGGFSTAIAVFCHELPHELGDFAVLLKAGMSAKQAVYYNVLSSGLSFMGMVLGVFIGETPEASAWVFACAAGMFIYIALVDMMPELTSTHNERCALSQCLLQLLGMVTGLGVMLLIALFEEDLKQIFATTPNYHHHSHHH